MAHMRIKADEARRSRKGIFLGGFTCMLLCAACSTTQLAVSTQAEVMELAFPSIEEQTDYDFSGKRIAVIGTGASAIQLVPQLAKTVGHMDVYQRTAPWIIPRNERPYLPAENWAFKNIPGLQNLIRGGIYTFNESVAAGMTFAPKALKPVEALCRGNIRKGIRDARLRKAVAESDAAQLNLAAHTLKGTLRFLAAEEGFQLALQLEMMAREADLEQAPRTFQSLEDHLARLTASLSAYLEDCTKNA